MFSFSLVYREKEIKGVSAYFTLDVNLVLSTTKLFCFSAHRKEKENSHAVSGSEISMNEALAAQILHPPRNICHELH